MSGGTRGGGVSAADARRVVHIPVASHMRRGAAAAVRGSPPHGGIGREFGNGGCQREKRWDVHSYTTYRRSEAPG